jgi:hypothetical protein
MNNEICYRCGLPRYELRKELTDDEIIQTYADIEGRGIVEFARAILRKAQENGSGL